ncbi:TetR/AcrR family transcriptional regulator [Burkholderiaceae bacterium DAT-1]|nr:TetR/AcrR family transcriptional regulator [Burkholderiaceae bacterium DAT-1]
MSVKELPADALLTPAMPGKLPRGATGLPPEAVELEQRKRLVRATAAVVAAKGYAQTTVSDIIKQAGVSRATFYALFADKEDCFLFGFRKLAEAHFRTMQEALTASHDASLQFPAAMRAYIDRINADTTLASAFIAEAMNASPTIQSQCIQAQQRLAQTIGNWIEQHTGQAPQPARLSLAMHGLTGYIIEQLTTTGVISCDSITAMIGFFEISLGLRKTS